VEDHPKYQAGQDPDMEPEFDHWPTTDELVALTRVHRQGEAYPTPQRLIENLPVVLRGLCDYVLSGEADAYHIQGLRMKFWKTMFLNKLRMATSFK
jgi:hypothetical protein